VRTRCSEQRGSIDLSEPTGIGDQSHGLKSWRPVHTPFQIADCPHAQPRPLSQLFLRQRRSDAMPPYEVT
jgi:hypothetical protein